MKHAGKNLVLVLSLLGAGFFLAWIRFRPWLQAGGPFTDGVQVYEDARAEGLRYAVWDTPRPLDPAVNTAAREDHPASSPDGRLLLFTVGRPGLNQEIWAADLVEGLPRDPRPVEALNSAWDDTAPAFAPGWVYFASNRPGGAGGLDLYRAPYRDGVFGAPEPLGSWNSEADDTEPAPWPGTGALVFASNRGGRGFDLWLARPGALEPSAEALAPLNGPFEERDPAFSGDGRSLFFASDRPGGAGGFDLYRALQEQGEWLPALPLDSLNGPGDERAPEPGLDGFRLLYATAEDGGPADLWSARSLELFPLPGRPVGWLDLTILAGLLLLALLAWLARRWDTVDLVYKCFLVAFLAHLLLLLWFRRVYPEAEPVELPRGERLFHVRLASELRRDDGARRERAGHLEARAAGPAAPSSPERAPLAAAALPGGGTPAIGGLRPAQAELRAPERSAVPLERSRAEAPAARAAQVAVPAEDLPLRTEDAPALVLRRPRAETAPERPVAGPVPRRQAAAASPLTAADPGRRPPSREAARAETPVAFEPAAGRLLPEPRSGSAGDLQLAAPAEALARRRGEASALALAPRAGSVERAGRPAPAPGRAGLPPGPALPPVERAAASLAPVAAGAAEPPAPAEASVLPAVPPALPEVAVAGPGVAEAAPVRQEEAPDLALDAAPRVPLPERRLPGGPAGPARPRAAAFSGEEVRPSAAALRPEAPATEALASAAPAPPAPRERPLPVVPLAGPAEVGEPPGEGIREPPGKLDLAELAVAPARRFPGGSAEGPRRAPGSARPPSAGPAPRLLPLAPAGAAASPPAGGPVRPTPAARPPSGQVRLGDLALREPEASGPEVGEGAAGPGAVLALEAPRRWTRRESAGQAMPAAPRSLLASARKEPRPRPAFRPLEAEAALRESAAPEALAFEATPYRNRFGELREIALREHGGSIETERAVAEGLAYLARMQHRAGYWGSPEDAHEKYFHVVIGKTGLGLLAFLGAGHLPGGDTEHSGVAARAVDFLLQVQDPATGHFGYSSSYSHGIATYALAECYALTRDQRLRRPLEQAVAWILRHQSKSRDPRRRGGWGYYFPDGRLWENDTWPRVSITAWQVMALESARLGGLEVPDQAFQEARRFLLEARDPNRSWFRYNHDPSRLASAYPTLPASTPAGLFALSLLGEDPASPRFARYRSFVLERRPQGYRRASESDFVHRAAGNLYFWYYGTLALFRSGGPEWERWNQALKETLLAGQEEDGSWRPISLYAEYAGDDERDRSYTTALCVLTLEVYYRYFTPLLQVQPEGR